MVTVTLEKDTAGFLSCAPNYMTAEQNKIK